MKAHPFQRRGAAGDLSAAAAAGVKGRLFSTTLTDNEGRFVLTARPTRSLRLFARKEGLGWAVWGPLGRLARGEPRRGIVLRFPRPAYIQGRVTGPQGRPVVAARVWATQARGAVSVDSTASDENGRFALGPLPGGRYRLVVVPPHGAAAGARPARVDLVLAPGERRRVDVSLAQGTVLTGVVLNDQGRVVLELAPERYRVQAVTAAGASPWAEADLRAGPVHLVLAVGAGAVLEGEVVDPQGRLGGWGRVDLFDVSGPEPVWVAWTRFGTGRYRLRGLRGGRYAVVAEARGAWAVAPAALAPGQTTHLRLVLRPAGALVVEVGAGTPQRGRVEVRLRRKDGLPLVQRALAAQALRRAQDRGRAGRSLRSLLTADRRGRIGPLELAPGTYEVSLKGQSGSRTVRVAPGRVTTLRWAAR